MISVYINSIGIAAPGFANWKLASQILKSEKNYEFYPLEKYKPARLPPNERRRATELVRLAFRICEDAFLDIDPKTIEEYASVFASSGGDYPIVDKICESLKTSDRFVSPTLFHNSVHNSAAGYWSIAAQSTKASTSLSAYDFTFAAGLLEAAMFSQHENEPCLLASYDIVPTSFFGKVCPILAEFGVAITMMPSQTELSQGRLDITLKNISDYEEPMEDFEQYTALLSNPTAKSLPLLTAVAKQENSSSFLQLNERMCLHLNYIPL